MDYHFVWTPKCRKTTEISANNQCKELDIEVISLETMPDHIHIFLKSTPVIAPNRIVAALKDTSRVLRKEFHHLRSTLPTLWTRSYLVSTHGHVSSETIRKYIEERQRRI
jgi:putative transposase